MKGHTIIELTDVKSGAKKVYEEDNMVTSALSDLTKSLQFFTSSIGASWFPEQEYFATSAFGGLFLFENELNENPDDFILPSGNKVVGLGCNLANNTVNTLMGTYNTTESGSQDDGSYKHVWDFSTDQGNGDISAVALAPRYTAQVGFGTPYDNYASSLVPSGSGIYSGPNSYFYTPTDRAYVCIIDGFLYSIPNYNLLYSSTYPDRHISRNGGKLILQRMRIAKDKFGIYNSPRQVNYIHDTLEIQLPSDFINSFSNTSTKYYASVQYNEGYLYITCMAGSWYVENGRSFKVAKVKLSDGTSETLTITNNSGRQYSIMYSSTSFLNSIGHSCTFVGNKMLVTSSSNENMVLDLSTMTYKDLTGLGNDTSVTLGITPTAIFGSFVLGYYYVSGSYLSCLINVDDCTVSRLQGNDYVFQGFSAGRSDRKIFVPIEGEKALSCAGSNYLYPGFNPFIMTTKNNLGRTVSKTPEQTMKVTYILTEEAE